jgi:hypothetical protein
MGRHNHPPLIWLALIGLGLSASVAGAEPAKPNWMTGENAAAAEGSDFAVLQVTTDNPDGLAANWKTASPALRLNSVSRIEINNPVAALIVFRGCKPNAEGLCNVTAEVTIEDPKGATIQHTPLMPLWVNQPPAPKNSLMLSPSMVGLGMDNTDPSGRYVIRYSITDTVAGITLKTRQSLDYQAKR